MSQRDPSIEFLGYVDDIRPLVHRSAVYICPIRDGGGTKLKMLDAMAMGRAIVAHPVATEGLDLVDGEQCLIAAEPAEFASKIVSALGSERQRRELGRSARRHVEGHFSFERIGADLAGIYRRNQAAMRASVAANLLYFPVTTLAGEPVRRLIAEYRRHDRLSSFELAAMQSGRLRDIVKYARHSTGHYALSNPTAGGWCAVNL